MRKAFDANVPKLKPRLRSAAPVADADAEQRPLTPTLSPGGGEGKTQSENAPRSFAEGKGKMDPALSLTEGEGRVREQAPVSAGRAPVDRGTPSRESIADRRDRLEKIKRRVAEAARPRAQTPAVPVDPAGAAQSVLGLVRDLESDLGRAHEREQALRTELDAARGDAARAAGEARAAVERLGDVEKQLEEKRGVLAELLEEMGALETERDEALRRAQGLAALDEERARLLEELSGRAEEQARLRAEREAEVERLSEDLRAGAADGARLRAALAEVVRERDEAAGQLAAVRREREELAAAKQALEQVHSALAQARARFG